VLLAKKALLALSMFVFTASAFAQQKAQAPIKIGFSIDSLKVERWQTDLDRFQKHAQELGAQVISASAEGDDGLQFKQSKKLIDSGVKVLVLVPHNSQSAARIVDAAHAKGVKVLCYDRLIPNSDVDFFVGFDGAAIGRLQAESLVKQAPKGNYVLVAGSPTDNNAKILRDAQMQVLKPLVDSGDIKIVSDFWAKDWSADEAYLNMSRAIDAAKGNIIAVVASNDGTAGGAIQALADRKLAGKVLVSGQDAELGAIIRVLEGTQTMTVYKPLASEARLAAEAAVALAKGETVSGAGTIPNGTRQVAAILLQPIAVTKDNVKETVIKDGFQTADSIKSGLSQDKWHLIED
jgi:D-xylose transport system substrate-binding protein